MKSRPIIKHLFRSNSRHLRRAIGKEARRKDEEYCCIEAKTDSRHHWSDRYHWSKRWLHLYAMERRTRKGTSAKISVNLNGATVWAPQVSLQKFFACVV